jgi:hypothetical protein
MKSSNGMGQVRYWFKASPGVWSNTLSEVSSGAPVWIWG